jgi:hypothetical protein
LRMREREKKRRYEQKEKNLPKPFESFVVCARVP